MNQLSGLALLGFLVVVWLVSTLIAWGINHKNLVQRYGAAPFNWRIFGFIFLYPPWLEEQKSKREGKQ